MALFRIVAFRAVAIAMTASLATGPLIETALAQDAESEQAQTISKEKLEQLVAPIALYPDPLLTQVLMASTYPLEVVQAARWSKASPKLKGMALENAMQK